MPVGQGMGRGWLLKSKVQDAARSGKQGHLPKESGQRCRPVSARPPPSGPRHVQAETRWPHDWHIEQWPFGHSTARPSLPLPSIAAGPWRWPRDGGNSSGKVSGEMVVLHGSWPHRLRLGPLGRWASSLGQKSWHSSPSAAKGAMTPMSYELNLEESCNLHFVGASLVAQMVKNLPECRRPGFSSWVGKIPWRRAWQPTPAFLHGESHGQRSLVGYSPWGHRVRKDWATWHARTYLFSKGRARKPEHIT